MPVDETRRANAAASRVARKGVERRIRLLVAQVDRQIAQVVDALGVTQIVDGGLRVRCHVNARNPSASIEYPPGTSSHRLGQIFRLVRVAKRNNGNVSVLEQRPRTLYQPMCIGATAPERALRKRRHRGAVALL
jgi:hypothetical protein